MEILVTLRKKQLLEKIVPLVDGIIIGKCFVSGYDYELEDLKTVSDYCKSKRCKVYIAMDNFILEDEKMLLYEYFDYIDLAVYFRMDYPDCNSAVMKEKLLEQIKEIVSYLISMQMKYDINLELIN